MNVIPMSLEELLKMPLIFLEKKSNSRQYVEDLLNREVLKFLRNLN